MAAALVTDESSCISLPSTATATTLLQAASVQHEIAAAPVTEAPQLQNEATGAPQEKVETQTAQPPVWLIPKSLDWRMQFLATHKKWSMQIASWSTSLQMASWSTSKKALSLLQAAVPAVAEASQHGISSIVAFLKGPHATKTWQVTAVMFVLFFLIIGFIIFFYQTKSPGDAKEESWLRRREIVQSDDDRIQSELRKGSLDSVGSADSYLKTPLAIATRSPNLNSLRQIAAPSNSRIGSGLALSPKVGLPFGDGYLSGENSGASNMLDSEDFCPALVVPRQCECILVVPVLAPGGNFDICDANGLAVLQCTSRQGSSWQLDLW